MFNLPPLPDPTQGLGSHRWSYSAEDMRAYALSTVKALNAQAERFEREWYLRGDALEWYRDEARALAKHMASGAHTSGVLASLTVLSLDAGRRADMALAPS